MRIVWNTIPRYNQDSSIDKHDSEKGWWRLYSTQQKDFKIKTMKENILEEKQRKYQNAKQNLYL